MCFTLCPLKKNRSKPNNKSQKLLKALRGYPMMKLCLIQSIFVCMCMGVAWGVQIYSGDYNIYDEKLNRVIVMGGGGGFLYAMLNEDLAYYSTTCKSKTGKSHPYKNGENQPRQRPKCKGRGNGNLVPSSLYTTVYIKPSIHQACLP